MTIFLELLRSIATQASVAPGPCHCCRALLTLLPFVAHTNRAHISDLTIAFALKLSSAAWQHPSSNHPPIPRSYTHLTLFFFLESREPQNAENPSATPQNPHEQLRPLHCALRNIPVRDQVPDWEVPRHFSSAGRSSPLSDHPSKQEACWWKEVTRPHRR